MYKRSAQALAIVIVAITMLGAADSSSRFNRIGHKMICACSCGQVLLECNHVGCPDSDRMIGELRGQISSGSSEASILNWFAAKYGATVLAAPIRGGFDTVAWIAPLAVFVLATFGTGVLVKTWKRRGGAANTGVIAERRAAFGDLGDIRERIRRETEV